MKSNYLNISLNDLEQFSNKKILVLGDVMVDETILGEVTRISPEAPVPIVNLNGDSTIVPGGASNTACNIQSLGGDVILFGVVGNDEYNIRLRNALKERGIDKVHLFEEVNRPTTVKTRVLGSAQGHYQQLIRLDREVTNKISHETEKSILNEFHNYVDLIGCVVLSDYCKGVLTNTLCQEIINTCNKNNIITIVDPKPYEISRFRNCTLLTPNIHEAKQITNMTRTGDESLKEMAQSIKDKFNSQSVVITLGKDGMLVLTESDYNIIPTNAKEVEDVTGAGDTVVAALSLALTSKLGFEESVTIANYAAGIAVGKRGTAQISLSELKKELLIN